LISVSFDLKSPPKIANIIIETQERAIDIEQHHNIVLYKQAHHISGAKWRPLTSPSKISVQSRQLSLPQTLILEQTNMSYEFMLIYSQVSSIF
jgi:hypothetical protein